MINSSHIKYLSFRKLKHLVSLWVSYQLSFIIKKDFRWGKYIALSIEPTNSCNLSCIECPTGTNDLLRKKGNFPIEAFKQLVEAKAKDLIYLNFYFQGEPFLNKDIIRMIRMASEKKIFTSISTNAQLINKALAEQIVSSGLNRIIISIDGASQEIYEKYRRGGELKLVIEATKFLIEAKKQTRNNSLQIVFQFLVFKHNEHQISEIKKLGADLGVDKVEIKTAQVYNYQKSKNITTINKYSRYKKTKKGEYEIKSNLPHRCWRMWHSVVVTQDLNLVPCCFDKDAEYVLGSLKDQTINSVEDSLVYKKFRQQITDGRSSIPMCMNCSEGLQ